MKFNPDQFIYFEWGLLKLNATIVYTWLIMLMLTIGSMLITRKLKTTAEINGWQNLVEVLVGGIAKHIEDITHQHPLKFLPFVGTLFIFILVSNILSIIPFYKPPTGSLSTTAGVCQPVHVHAAI